MFSTQRLSAFNELEPVRRAVINEFTLACMEVAAPMVDEAMDS